jgi:hypothetical protein
VAVTIPESARAQVVESIIVNMMIEANQRPFCCRLVGIFGEVPDDRTLFVRYLNSFQQFPGYGSYSLGANVFFDKAMLADFGTGSRTFVLSNFLFPPNAMTIPAGQVASFMLLPIVAVNEHDGKQFASLTVCGGDIGAHAGLDDRRARALPQRMAGVR